MTAQVLSYPLLQHTHSETCLHAEHSLVFKHYIMLNNLQCTHKHWSRGCVHHSHNSAESIVVTP